MQVIDPGHQYLLSSFDGGEPMLLTFVKRNAPSEKYPGNIDTYPGTQTQEVLRALIDRSRYVNNQIPSDITTTVITLLQEAIILLEKRHTEQHNMTLIPEKLQHIETVPFCNTCGHITCFCTAA